jgi:hypothetical protein
MLWMGPGLDGSHEIVVFSLDNKLQGNTIIIDKTLSAVALSLRIPELISVSLKQPQRCASARR